VPNDEMSWVGRAEGNLGVDDAAALADVEEALKLNPLSMFGLQLKAHILAERLRRPADAVRVLDTAVELYPDYAAARAGRGVLLARQAKRAEAVRDAEDALLCDTKAPNLYQVACIFALTSKARGEDRLRALELLRPALRSGFGLDLVDTDPDLDPLRPLPEFRRLVAAARDVQRPAPK
jgi:tetratricopeptide (TPR) repeat protein